MPTRVYQFKIELLEVKPAVWRRIQVPEKYSFWDLHVAIQDALGWMDYHLHHFSFADNGGDEFLIGIPDEDGFDEQEVHASWEVGISKAFYEVGQSCIYVYDYGDDWNHRITLEAILLKERGVKVPRILDGKNACPPEDCGGSMGYSEFLKAIRDKKHEEHEELLKWVGGRFDPEAFDINDVTFDNPMDRFRLAFEGE